jgi:glycosyltransferase involved in cell wall biosynthesis
MRILLLAQFFPPDIGGEERHVFNLANTLAMRGHEVAVATQYVSGFPEKEVLPSGVRVYRFSTMAMNLPGVYSADRRHHPPFPDPLGIRNLRLVLQWERPEIVHAHNWIVNSILPLRRVGGIGKPFALVLTLHDYSQVCATKRMMRDESICQGPAVIRCLKCAVRHYGHVVGPVTTAATAAMRPWKERVVDYIVSVSRAVADGNGILDGPAASVIPNFILDSILESTETPLADTAIDRIKLELPSEPYLLFVGDLSREKGVQALLGAYDSIRTNRPPLVLIGRRTQDTPTRLPDGAVMHLEWPHERILSAFRCCLAAVLPSVWPDPCPTTVLEGMASGCPVITTSIGGMVDMVVNEKSGLLVSPNDERELSRAISRVLTDNMLRIRLGTEARDRVSKLFTASIVAEKLEAVYKLVAPRSSSVISSSGVRTLQIDEPSSNTTGAM